MRTVEKRASLSIERVEERLLLAGTVDVNVAGDVLEITGDSHDNSVYVVEINQSGANFLNAQFGANAEAGDFVVLSQGDTQLNAQGSHTFQIDNLGFGSLNDAVIVDGADSILAEMRGGNDLLEVGVPDDLGPFLSGLSPAEQAAIRACIRDVHVEDLTLRTGTGDDSLRVNRVQVSDDAVVRNSGGSDDMLFSSIQVGDDVLIRTGAGEDVVGVSGVDVAGNTDVGLGLGDDTLILGGLPSFFGGQLELRGNAGDDTLVVLTPPTVDDADPVVEFENVV